MDDERVDRALRRGPPGDPPFEPSGRWIQVAPALELEAQRARRHRVQAFAGLVAVAAVLVVAAVVAGPLLELRERGVGGLVADVERRGVIRVAIDGGPPLAFGPSVGYDGFDIDMARDVAARLGVRLELVVVPRDEILDPASDGEWDVAMSFVPDVAPLGPAALTTDAYAVVPGGFGLRQDDDASAPEDLAGESLCVVSGSAAQAWMTGGFGSPPADAELVVRATLEECLAAVADRSVRAVTVDRRSDLGGAGLRVLASPPFELRLVAVVDGSTDGASSLVARLDQLFAEMAADGTIREYGQRRFAGDDVTPPTD